VPPPRADLPGLGLRAKAHLAAAALRHPCIHAFRHTSRRALHVSEDLHKKEGLMLFGKRSQRRGSEHPAIRSACKYAVERLENRLLLSTTTDLAQEKAAAIRDGLSDLADFADKLETFGALGKQAPAIGKSVGQALDLGNAFRSNVLAPLQTLLATDLTPTPAQIRGAIQTVLDALPTSGNTVTIVQDAKEIRYDIQFVSTQTGTFPLTLEDTSTGFGFKASAAVKGSLDARFSFGIDLTDGLAPSEAFFVDLNGPAGTSSGLKASASLDLSNFQLGGRLGAVDVKLGDGAGGEAETLKALAEVGIGFNDAPDGRKTISDLQNSTPSALVSLSTGPASGG
jgi:hypothetical protein